MSVFPVRFWTAVGLLAACLSFLGLPANAVGSGAPVLLSSTRVPDGWVGPVRLDFSNTPTGYYEVRLGCADSYPGSKNFTYNGSNNTLEMSVTPLVGPDTCTLTVRFGNIGNQQEVFSQSIIVVRETPQILEPDSQVAEGWAGPIRVDFTNTRAGTYRVIHRCDNPSFPQEKFVVENAGGADNVWEREALDRGLNDDAGECAVIVEYCDWENMCDPSCFYEENYCTSEGVEEVARRAFAVEPFLSSFRIQSASVSPVQFYPTIRDGYRDTVKFVYNLNRPSRVVFKVNDSTGRRVKTSSSYYTSGYNRGSWTWNGRTSSGAMARAGKYKIQLNAWSGSSYASTSRTVELRSGTFTRYGSQRRMGSNGAFSTSGPCYIERDYEAQTADLDSWGGTCTARYGFRVPSSAFNLSYQVGGGYLDSDLCCKGSVSRSASRTDSTHYAVTVKVNGTHAWYITSVLIKYAYKARL